jgi:hypothetical protein
MWRSYINVFTIFSPGGTTLKFVTVNLRNVPARVMISYPTHLKKEVESTSETFSSLYKIKAMEKHLLELGVTSLSKNFELKSIVACRNQATV